MSGDAKFTVRADSVIKNFKKTIDLTKNFAPLWEIIRGKEGDSGVDTIRGGIANSFHNKVSPYGRAWASLTENYMKRKQKKYPGQTTLVASGSLFNSLTRRTGFTVDIPISGTRFVYGTIIPYAGYLQSGTKKMISRAFLGFRNDQKKAINALIGAYVAQTMLGVKKPKVDF